MSRNAAAPAFLALVGVQHHECWSPVFKPKVWNVGQSGRMRELGLPRQAAQRQACPKAALLQEPGWEKASTLRDGLLPPATGVQQYGL